MMKVFGAVVVFSMMVGGAALAEEPQAGQPAPAPSNVTKPSPDAVKSVWDFFYKGKGAGVVLADAKLCTKVGKEGETKFECTEEVGPEGVKAGSTVMVWQAYLVPQGDAVEDITIQLKQGDTVRETKDVAVKGEGWRARTWTGLRLPKAGDWTIVIARGSDTLKTFNVKATK